jgi:hypothetical protein
MQREGMKLTLSRGDASGHTSILDRISWVLYVQITTEQDVLPRVALPYKIKLQLNFADYSDNVRAMFVCGAAVRYVQVDNGNADVVCVKTQDHEARPNNLVREDAGHAPRQHTAHRIK